MKFEGQVFSLSPVHFEQYSKIIQFSVYSVEYKMIIFLVVLISNRYFTDIFNECFVILLFFSCMGVVLIFTLTADCFISVNLICLKVWK